MTLFMDGWIQGTGYGFGHNLIDSQSPSIMDLKSSLQRNTTIQNIKESTKSLFFFK